MLLTILCALALHRIWIYEDIFAQVRAALEKRRLGPVKKALLCPACFGFWAGMLAACLVRWCPIEHSYLLYGLAAYLPVRVSVWFGRHASAVAISLATGEASRGEGPPPVKATVAKPKRCPSCEEKQRAAGRQAPPAHTLLLRSVPASNGIPDGLAKALLGLGYRLVCPAGTMPPTGCGIWDGTTPVAIVTVRETTSGTVLAIENTAQNTTRAVPYQQLDHLQTTGEQRTLVEQLLAGLKVPAAKAGV